MAQTQKFYRLGQRKPRQTTQLSAFANGMYLTQQTIPEGYAKAMVNYDIDDTGSHIRPRRGRQLIQGIDKESPKLGPVSLTDYIYSYREDNIEIEDIKDIVMSYGLFTNLETIVSDTSNLDSKYIYVSYLTKTIDSNVYSFNPDTEEYEIIEPGEIREEDYKEFWALYYDKDTESFIDMINLDIGFVSARAIDHAYSFDKAFTNIVGRPIGTVLNNELIAFTGAKLDYTEYTSNPERNELSNYSKPNISKFIVTDRTDGTCDISRKVMEPRKLNALEANSTGFNILSDEPFIFENEIGGSLSILSILKYKTDDLKTPVFGPKVGEPLSMHITYQYPEGLTDPIKYKVEWIDLTNDTATWQVLSDYTESITAGDEFRFTYTPTVTNSSFRVTIRRGDKTETEYPYATTVRCAASQFDNVEMINFDLTTCKGMVNWWSRVGVYGVAGALNSIFFSDVEDPSYFPFPNNVVTFDNEILYVHNYLDYLLVITVDSIWLITGDGTAAGTLQKRVLANIFIPEIDAVNTVVLKDQIFFKTDTQFYVLKPNQYTSDATDLKNYVNSTAIANYTEHFTEETVNLLNEVYKPIWQDLTKQLRKQIRFEDFDVLDLRSIVRNEEVHYVYTILPRLTDSIVLDKLNLHLVYNTMSRSWRLYFNAIGKDTVSFNPILYRNKQSGSFYEFFPYSDAGKSRIAITKQTYNVVTDDFVDVNDWHLTTQYNNYPYIDTGTIAVEDINTKRFRELQFNLVNMEHTMIKFYADFKLDGKEWIHATQYEMQHIVDEDDPDYGMIYIVPVEHTNLNLAGLTTLADNIIQDEYWALDISKFPKLDNTTVRFTLQGRGRRGSLQLLNTSLKRYQLSNLNWVYRTMSAR